VRELIDVTPMTEANPHWEYIDKKGHKHHYIHHKDGTLGDPKTLKLVQTDCLYDGDEDFFCKKCGEEIEPGIRGVTERQYLVIDWG